VESPNQALSSAYGSLNYIRLVQRPTAQVQVPRALSALPVDVQALRLPPPHHDVAVQVDDPFSESKLLKPGDITLLYVGCRFKG
jgi:hypothetical protein